jgi:hypothetical protein
MKAVSSSASGHEHCRQFCVHLRVIITLQAGEAGMRRTALAAFLNVLTAVRNAFI